MSRRAIQPFPASMDFSEANPPNLEFGITEHWMFLEALPTTWETGMTTYDSGMDPRRNGRGKSTRELAERLEGYIERRASGRIRDLHVVCSDDSIILQGRSRTYHAKQLAQQ